MQDVKMLFDFSTSVMKLELHLYGFDISLFNILCWSLCAFFVLYIFYGIMK